MSNQDNQFKLKLSQVKSYLFSRFEAKTKNTLRDLTLDKVDEWSNFWGTHANEVQAQMTGILIRKYEKEMFKSKEYEAGYREGLKELAELWRKCYETGEAARRVDIKRDQIRKAKSKRLNRKALV